MPLASVALRERNSIAASDAVTLDEVELDEVAFEEVELDEVALYRSR